MASTVPAKSSNPLHNFDLPHLKWKKNNNHNHHPSTNNNNHQRRRSSKLSPSRQHDSPPLQHNRQSQSQSPMSESALREPVAAAVKSPMRESVAMFGRSPAAGAARQSPMRESVVAARQSPMRESVAVARHSPMRELTTVNRRSPMRESVVAARHSPMRESVGAVRQSPVRESVVAPARQSVPESNDRSNVIEYRRNSRISAAPESTSTKHKVPDKKHNVQETDVSGNNNIESRSSKILIKIPRKNKSMDDEIQEEQQKGTEESQADEDETVPKTWNLRPRKPIHKSLNLNGGPFKPSGSVVQENKSQSLHMNVNNKPDPNTETQKKEKRQRFSISISREEIDEDIYAMTGSKAARRPKKRAKAVQKQLDTLFPGLWLASITPDSYKVCENLPKG